MFWFIPIIAGLGLLLLGVALALLALVGIPVHVSLGP